MLTNQKAGEVSREGMSEEGGSSPTLLSALHSIDSNVGPLLGC